MIIINAGLLDKHASASAVCYYHELSDKSILRVASISWSYISAAHRHKLIVIIVIVIIDRDISDIVIYISG